MAQRKPAEQSTTPGVTDLDAPSEQGDAAQLGAVDDGDDDDTPPPLGEPFALATGADLLQQAQGIPGSWASLRCDCGRAFKIDLLSPGVKCCPGCQVPYSHVLLVAPADDTEIVSAFLDTLDEADVDEVIDVEAEPA